VGGNADVREGVGALVVLRTIAGSDAGHVTAMVDNRSVRLIDRLIPQRSRQILAIGMRRERIFDVIGDKFGAIIESGTKMRRSPRRGQDRTMFVRGLLIAGKRSAGIVNRQVGGVIVAKSLVPKGENSRLAVGRAKRAVKDID